MVDLKLCEKSAIFLTRKGDIYQLGEYYKDNEKRFSECPKKIDKFSTVRQIFSGSNHFFAFSDTRGLFGWGDNSLGQISSLNDKKIIPTPQSLKICVSNAENIQIVAGSSTTFLLSSQKV